MWETAERILVAVTAAPGTDALLRRAARMAARVKADLHVVHVVADEGARPMTDDQLIGLRQLAADVGAHWHEIQGDDPAQALTEFARSTR